MIFQCIVYGLRIQANIAIAGVAAKCFDGPPHVVVHLHEATRENFSNPPGQLLFDGIKSDGVHQHSFHVRRTAHDVCIRYILSDALVEFVLSPSGDSVDVRWSPDFPTADIPAFLFGPVIGCVLRLRGVEALHAGVIAVDGAAIAIVGEKGAGKSTLVGALARRGCAVLSDDVAPLITDSAGIPHAQPGLPRLRLWPATLTWLGIFDEHAPRVESIFDKRYFELRPSLSAEHGSPWRFYPRPLPLRAVYLLAPRRTGIGCTIEPAAPTLALHTLLQHGYCDYMLDAAGRMQRFTSISRLVPHLPVYIVQRPDDLHAIDAVCDSIIG